LDYKEIWRKLEKKLIYANDNAHPRFKGMGERPTIQISKVLRMMKELETDQVKRSNKRKGGHRKKLTIRPKPESRASNGVMVKMIV